MLSDTMMLGGGRKAAYSIENSLLFRGGQYLSRTFVTPTDQYVWTFSTWIRRAALNASAYFDLFCSTTTSGSKHVDICLFNDAITIEYGVAGTSGSYLTGPLLRDTGSWYHIVVSADLRSSTDPERIKVYVNGQKVVLTGSQPARLSDWGVNSAVMHTLGAEQNPGASHHFPGSMAETAFVDGEALPPTKFGEFDPLTGSWRPKLVQGVDFGSNGFYLGKPWSVAGSVNDLGTDYSGKGNHWTPTGFAASDVLRDSPTNVYATLNPLNYSASRMALSAGNLVATASNGSGAGSTLRLSSGKWYFETTLTSGSGAYNCVGLFDAAANVNMGLFARDGGWFVGSDGTKYDHGTATTGYGAAAVAGDRLICAVDMDAGKVWWGKNGTWFSGVPATGTAPAFENLAGKAVYPGVAIENGYSQEINFGQRPFTYTPPSGFKALCTANLPVPVSAAAKQPGKYYSCQKIVHNGSGSAVTLGWDALAADWLVRIKSLGSGDWYYIDTKRGLDKVLVGNSTQAEMANAAMVTNRTASGFVLGSGLAAATYLVEAWRVAPEAGFDILIWTGNGTSRTIPHNNGTAPAFMIVKNRDNGAEGWSTWHKDLTPAGYILTINNDNSQLPSATDFDSTAPIASVITVGTNVRTNENLKPFVAYVWSEVPGFSAFGSYVGNASADGPYVWLGFTAGEHVVKRTDDNSGWYLLADAINTYNPASNDLDLNSTSAVPSSAVPRDIVAGGLKFRSSAIGTNASGGKYIYAAWAAHPLGAKRVTPATAR